MLFNLLKVIILMQILDNDLQNDIQNGKNKFKINSSKLIFSDPKYANSAYIKTIQKHIHIDGYTATEYQFNGNNGGSIIELNNIKKGKWYVGNDVQNYSVIFDHCMLNNGDHILDTDDEFGTVETEKICLYGWHNFYQKQKQAIPLFEIDTLNDDKAYKCEIGKINGKIVRIEIGTI